MEWTQSESKADTEMPLYRFLRFSLSHGKQGLNVETFVNLLFSKTFKQSMKCKRIVLLNSQGVVIAIRSSQFHGIRVHVTSQLHNVLRDNQTTEKYLDRAV